MVSSDILEQTPLYSGGTAWDFHPTSLLTEKSSGTCFFYQLMLINIHIADIVNIVKDYLLLNGSKFYSFMNNEKTTSYWDSMADSLSRQRMAILKGKEYAYWEEALSTLLPKEKPLRILDVGTGSGILALILSKMGHNVVGIDISPLMVQCAYETASALSQRIEYRIMDCKKLDFNDESFDALVCCEVMSSLHDRKNAWVEFKRVLKKSGRLVVFDTGEINTSQLQAQGFSHCRINDSINLRAFKKGEVLHCLSGRKPSRDEKENIPQIALFSKHIQTAKRQIQLYQNWCQSIGMPFPEYTVLNMVSRHSKGVRPSDISSALVIPPQTLTRILAGLQHDGFIDRRTSDSDHRSSVITITENGVEKMKPLQAALHEIEEKALFRFEVDELSDFCGLSDKLLKALESSFESQTK